MSGKTKNHFKSTLLRGENLERRELMAVGLTEFASANFCQAPCLATQAIVAPATPHLSSTPTLATTNAKAVQCTAYVATIISYWTK